MSQSNPVRLLDTSPTSKDFDTLRAAFHLLASKVTFRDLKGLSKPQQDVQRVIRADLQRKLAMGELPSWKFIDRALIISEWPEEDKQGLLFLWRRTDELAKEVSRRAWASHEVEALTKEAVGPSRAQEGLRQIEDEQGYDFKPNPLTARTSYEFVGRMCEFRKWAGDVALRELVRRSDGAFALSTLSTALRGRNLPPQTLVVAFIRACGGDENEVRRWVTAWRQIRMPADVSTGRGALAEVKPLHARGSTN